MLLLSRPRKTGQVAFIRRCGMLLPCYTITLTITHTLDVLQEEHAFDNAKNWLCRAKSKASSIIQGDYSLESKGRISVIALDAAVVFRGVRVLSVPKVAQQIAWRPDRCTIPVSSPHFIALTGLITADRIPTSAFPLPSWVCKVHHFIEWQEDDSNVSLTRTTTSASLTRPNKCIADCVWTRRNRW